MHFHNMIKGTSNILKLWPIILETRLRRHFFFLLKIFLRGLRLFAGAGNTCGLACSQIVYLHLIGSC